MGIRHRLAVLCASSLLATAIPCAAGSPPAESTHLGAVAFPGGITAARAVLRDHTSPSRASFLAECIRRFYDTPRESGDNQQPLLQALLAHLQQVSQDPAAPSDDVPLPLGVTWWSTHVLGGRATPRTLVLQMLRSRDAALLYCALLQLDGDTRLWFGGQHALVSAVMRGQAAHFLVAAPGVRVEAGRMAVPGGDSMRDAWEAVVGARTADPAAFLARVLEPDDGVLAYFLGRTALLPAGALDAVLGAASDRDRPAALTRLFGVFRRSAEGWRVGDRPFSSIPDDPTVLMADAHAEIARGSSVAGSERFWSSVFDARGDLSALGPLDGEDARPVAGVLWLLERLARSPDVERRARAAQVRFALRVVSRMRHGSPRDRATALIGLRACPALVRTLERMGVTDPAVLRVAIERAAELRSIADERVQARSTAEFQGAVALLARATSRGSVAARESGELVSSLASVSLDPAGAYGDRVVRWVDTYLRPLAHRSSAGAAAGLAGTLDDDLVAMLSALPGIRPSTIVWEGTRYRVDLARGDARRVELVRGDHPPRLLDQGARLFEMAARGAAGRLTRDDARHQSAELLRILGPASAPGDDGPAWTDPRDARAVRLLGAAARGRRADPREVTAALRDLAEDLLARGFAELAYAAALGGSDLLPLTAAEAASRHDLGIVRIEEERGAVAWRLPVTSVRTRGPWHIEGALLALDIALVDTWLRRTSDRPLTTPPTVDRGDRRAMSEVVVTMNPAALTDDDMARIVGAIEAGRRRVVAARTEGDATRLVASIPLGALRRSLLPWMLVEEPEQFRGAFSPAELLRIGSPELDVRTLDAWGAPARPRLGCVCLEFPARQPDLYTGFLSSGILTGTIPDLNLRMAEHLHALHMPAALLPGMLAPATLSLVDRAPSRFPDDLRAIVEQINALSLDDAEQYLSLLTVDGPLVPESGDDTHAAGGHPQ